LTRYRFGQSPRTRLATAISKDSSTSPVEIALKEIREGLIELQPMTKQEIDDLQKTLEEQAAAQSLLSREQEAARPGEPSTRAITEFLKS